MRQFTVAEPAAGRLTAPTVTLLLTVSSNSRYVSQHADGAAVAQPTSAVTQAPGISAI
jgi:hypothetical protein